ncbi:MAG: CoA pyrophosphatase [Chromatiales bacterium]|nr:CoA pyrophosphatase [Chromatiales bacterium]
MTANLAGFSRRAVEGDGLRHAAVAVTLVDDEDGDRPCFLITRRGRGLNRHRGQWALPGGRVDAGETAVEAALRELHEELGLRRDTDDVLGLLDDYPTRSGYRITPVVVWGGPVRELHPDPGEVAAVYRVPLSDLDRPGIPHLERIPESDRPVLSVPLESLGTRVYAPTAAVIYQTREVALHGRATRVAEFDQPVFAWR